MVRRVALLVTLVACAPKGRTEEARRAPEAVDVKAVDAGPPLAMPPPPAPAAEPVLLPLPAAVPGTDPQAVRMAASVCAASYMRSPATNALEVGCVWHPPFDKPDQKPNGRLTEFTGDPLAFCAIEHVFEGSFSKPGAKEAIVAFSQCKESDDATWDMGFPGSALLVEASGDRWRTTGYRDGLNLRAACKRARRKDGHEVLVCDSGFWAGMSGELAYVFVVDFAQPEPAKTIARLYSHVFGCQYGGTLPDGFTRTTLKDVTVADRNGDGVADLVVTATRSRLLPSPNVDARITAACAKNERSGLPVALPPAATTKLVFVADDAGYTPDAATAKVLAAWAADDGTYRGLGGVAP